MKKIFFYVDATQHISMCKELVSIMGNSEEYVVISAVPISVSDFPDCVSVYCMVGAFISKRSNIIAKLVNGLSELFEAKKYLSPYIKKRHIRVLITFNDTGIVQRALFKHLKSFGLLTALVQDGFLTVDSREGSLAFGLKYCFTKAFLNPFGLSWVGTTKFGTSNPHWILVDGPKSKKFFRQRSPESEILIVGLLRERYIDINKINKSILFWGVDFLTGLNDRRLHVLQIKVINELANALCAIDVKLRFRVHPNDIEHIEIYKNLFYKKNVITEDPRAKKNSFEKNLPLLSCTLLSAGLLDSLACKTPSFFIEQDFDIVLPDWASKIFISNLDMLVDTAHKFACDFDYRNVLLEQQIKAIQSDVEITPNVSSILMLLNNV